MVEQLSTKTLIWLSGTIMGAIVVIAMLMQHQHDLQSLWLYIEWTFLGGIGIALLYLLYLTWHNVSIRQLERKHRQAEIAKIESEKWAAEQLLLGQQQLDLERLKLEQIKTQQEQERLMMATRWQVQHATIPVGHTLVIRDDQYGSNGYATFQSPRLVEKSEISGPVVPEHAEDEEIEETIPQAPAFPDMCHLISNERMVLCYVKEGPAYGTVDDVLSMAVTGKPGRGKTTALMYYVTVLLKSGAEVVIWDPHGAMAELAVLNGCTLQGLPPTAKVTYLDRKQDIIQSIPGLLHELEVRDTLYRATRQTKHPFLLLADELPVLADYDEELAIQYKAQNKRQAREGEDIESIPSLIKVIRKVVLEARKWRCFFIGSGQSFDAQILPTRVTENFNSRIVFFSSDRRARMSGLENDAIKTLLPTIRRAGSGVMIFDCSRWDGPVIGAIPMITVEHMLAFLQATPTSKDSPVPTSQRPQLHLIEAASSPPFEEAEKPCEEAEEETPLTELEQTVLDLLMMGSSQKQIIQQIWQTTGGDRYVKASAEMQRITAKLLKRKHA
ncbi:hypothetical protein [Tengunoibacter tsumagoiensis]|uniref:Uncharacterized protein n=1 Tax=Tengunoibacter tsumagoiensis TaxID=2014871 RepID=A0A402A8I0_9CHLR|nr:hypothetical protein [Tengunoibacter tsumagoiensis]GCE15316.1 hypothetical protein KTT_51750 [Tengunoibacter tsumagoiensis]